MATPPPRRFGVGMSEAARRQHIKDAARSVFGRNGYRHAKISDLMAAAGIARRTFYAYFERKEDLVTELLDDFMARIEAARDLAGLRQAATADELRRHYAGRAQELMAILSDNRDMVTLLFEGLSAGDDVLEPRAQSIVDTLSEFFRESIEIAMAKGLLRPVDPQVVAFLFTGMFMEALRRIVVLDEGIAPDVWAREILALIETGFVREAGDG